MDGFSLPDNHPFKDDPEMALILAWCLSEWDHIEYAMVLVFAGLLDTDYFKAEKVFWSQHGLSARVGMIRELCLRPGAIDKEIHERIIDYLKKIKPLSEKRNLLIHGMWFRNTETGTVFRVKVRPDMFMHMLEDKNKLKKEDMEAIGYAFVSFREDFVPFALNYYGARLKAWVKNKMACVEAQNPGSTVVLGGAAKAGQGAEPVTKKAAPTVAPVKSVR